MARQMRCKVNSGFPPTPLTPLLQDIPTFKDPWGARGRQDYHAIFVPARDWVAANLTAGEQSRAVSTVAREAMMGTFGRACPEGVERLSVPVIASVLGDLRAMAAVLHGQASPSWYGLAVAKVILVMEAAPSKGTLDIRAAITRAAALTLLTLLLDHNTPLASQFLSLLMDVELVSLEEAAQAATQLADSGEPLCRVPLVRLTHATPLPEDIRALTAAWSQPTQRPAALHTQQMMVLDQHGKTPA